MLKKSCFMFLSGAALLLNAAPCLGHDDHSTSSDKASQEPTANLAKVSEAFGNFIGRTLSNPNAGIQFDIENVIKGIKEGAAGRPSPLTEQEYEKAIADLQESAFKKLSEANLKAANQFLENNAKEKNVVVIEPGKLEYIILKEGSGPALNEHSSPLIHYTGKFIDGTVFGSSEETGPISISLDRTIPGFSKGLVGMKQGEKRRLFIHPDLAYGTRGDLPPNALLIFDVEVVDVTSPDEKQPKISLAQELDKSMKDSDMEDTDEDDADEEMEEKDQKGGEKKPAAETKTAGPSKAL